MLNQEIVKRLKQFNEKADALMNLDFINLLLTTKPGVTVAAENERSGPDSKAVDEFVQTFGFFLPDDDKASLNEISRTYSDLAEFEQERTSFESVRTKLNAFLDTQSKMEVGGSLTKRELLQIFVYGALAGVNTEKKKTYEKWIAEDVTQAIITNRFIGILVKVFESITNVRRINEAVIAGLTS